MVLMYISNIKNIVRLTIYYVLSGLNFIIPKKENFILLFDEQYKKDNTYSIARYLANQNNYEILYYSQIRIDYIPNVRHINNKISAVWYQMRSRLVFYSYRGDGYLAFKSFHGQKIIDTTHGSPLKKIGYNTETLNNKFFLNYEKTFDYILAQSPFFIDVIKKSFGASDDQIISFGFPRNDDINRNVSIFEKLLLDNQFDKNILWMPTWRNAAYGDSGVDVSVYSFPVINSQSIMSLNEYLIEKNIRIVIKPHPFQLDLDIFKVALSNIIVLKNYDLDKANLNLYDSLNSFDALITDYSSIYFDYLLTNKPIAFTIDDIEEYERYQGFSFENPKKLMPGKYILDINDLKQFINEISENIDEFKEERNKLNNVVNAVKDFSSTKKIIDFLNK